VLDDIKAEVDRIITFPEETEKPIIAEIVARREVVTIVLYGDVSEKTLKKLADRVRDDLTAMEDISQVDVAGVRPYEISIEVPEENLRRYGLNFDHIAAVVQPRSCAIPLSIFQPVRSKPPEVRFWSEPKGRNTTDLNLRRL
ncbi:MAG: efflux RND transporter permease subunit, partial [Planctomycetota bacterium]|jgi:multidrug efflux pump subunit AcrB